MAILDLLMFTSRQELKLSIILEMMAILDLLITMFYCYTK
jgi:hypothetical protein